MEKEKKKLVMHESIVISLLLCICILILGKINCFFDKKTKFVMCANCLNVEFHYVGREFSEILITLKKRIYKYIILLHSLVKQTLNIEDMLFVCQFCK